MAHHSDFTFPETARAESGATSLIMDNSLVIKLPNDDFFAIDRYREKMYRLRYSYVDDIAEADLISINAAFMAYGVSDSFLIRNWADWNSTDDHAPASGGAAEIDRCDDEDQVLLNTSIAIENYDGVVEFRGDGTTTVFHVVKRYEAGATDGLKRIRMPRTASLLVAINDVAQTGGGTDYTVDATGQITFNSAPTVGLDVTWGGIYDLAAVFDESTLEMKLPFSSAREMDGLRFREVRLKDA